MNLDQLLKEYKKGAISEGELIKDLKMDHLATLENKFHYDLGREARAGFPEAVLALRKSAEDVARILETVLPKKDKIFVTRLEKEKMDRIRQILDGKPLLEEAKLSYHENSHLLVAKKEEKKAVQMGCTVGIIAAGTSDAPVAEEAEVILGECGLHTISARDVGVAGLHRLLGPLKRMLDEDVDILIVVAGMEGALPSVVKGLVDLPVIGVPTSVGYGYKAGESALISMLNSCVPGLLVTNVDNGFGAAAAAYGICSRISKYKSPR